MNARKRRQVPGHRRRGDRRWSNTVLIWTLLIILATLAIAYVSTHR